MKNPLNRVFSSNKDNNNLIKILHVSLDRVIPSPYQPREDFDHERILKLGESISEYGLMQPLVVTERERGYYELIAGERRLRACKAIGLEKVPVILKEVTEEKKAEMTLVENLQRHNLNFIEEALGYRQLLDLFGLTQEELARRLGKSQSTIANKLRLLKLPASILDRLHTDDVLRHFSERHARALLSLNDETKMQEVFATILEKRLTVRETEEYIKRSLKEKDEKKRDKDDGRLIKIFKDLRLSLNSIKNTVKEIEEAGYDVQMEEVEHQEFIEVKIKLGKGETRRGVKGGS